MYPELFLCHHDSLDLIVTNNDQRRGSVRGKTVLPLPRQLWDGRYEILTHSLRDMDWAVTEAYVDNIISDRFPLKRKEDKMEELSKKVESLRSELQQKDDEHRKARRKISDLNQNIRNAEEKYRIETTKARSI